MEQLNYRFLNYKKYNTFAKDLADEKIREDAIVFVQDKPCIWARGKEYVCDGPNTADIQSGTFTFKNGKDQIIFSASLEDGVITLTDGNGNSITLEYVLKNWYDGLQTNLRTKFKSVDDSIEDIEEDIRDLDTDKQDKLIPGENISITNNENGKPIISAIIDTSLYIMVLSLDDVTYPNPNKIYLLETTDQNGDTIHELYKWSLEDQEWIRVGTAAPEVDMSKYLQLEYEYLRQNYQPKGEYAGKQWVLDTFVKQSSVYTPTDGSTIGGGSGSEGEGSSGVVIPSGNSNITVDKTLSTLSANPVENRTITIALQGKVDNSALQQYAKKSDLTGKVDSTELENYVTNIQHIQDLATKQNVLTAGSGISIENNTISVSDSGYTSNMVTLTTEQYQNLVDKGLVNESTYYFTYEGEVETDWTFGGTFPVILSGGNGLGEFPITLI